MSTPTPDYGEPWKISGDAKAEEWISATNWTNDVGDIICSPPVDAVISVGHWKARSERIITCVNACAGIPDPTEHLANLNKELAELREWKRQQLEVERQWDCQKVGKLLGVPAGAHVRPHIEPKIAKLCEENAKLREALENCREDSIELLGERDWWKEEPRCGYQERYAQTAKNIQIADALLTP